MSTSGGIKAAIVGQVGAVAADSVFNLAGDNGFHSFECAKAAPPSWMNAAGDIIAPGLYLVECDINKFTNPTTAGLFVDLTHAVGTTAIAWDMLTQAAELKVGKVWSVATADLPFSTQITVFMPTDVTGVLKVQNLVSRLVSA